MKQILITYYSEIIRIIYNVSDFLDPNRLATLNKLNKLKETLTEIFGAVCLFVSIYIFLAVGCAMSQTCSWPEVWGF